MNFLDILLNLSRLQKRVIAFILDLFVSNFVVFLVFILYFQNTISEALENLTVLLFLANSYIIFFLIFKIYNIIFRYYGFKSFVRFIFSLLINYSFQLSIIYFLNLENYFYLLIFLKFFIFASFYNFLRLFISNLVNNIFYNKNVKNTCLIYGSDSNSFNIYKQLDDFAVFGFVDIDKSNIGNKIENVKIYNHDQAKKLIKLHNISHLIVTSKNLSFDKKRYIFDEFSELNIRINFIPNITEIINSKINLNDFQFSDILDRKIFINYEKIEEQIFQKNILITGAGGSIGSELVRQISLLKPTNLILIDNNEYALYTIEKEIIDSLVLNNIKLNIVTKLVSIQNFSSLEIIFKKYEPNIVFHAAAYKHVPMLESNIVETITNNVFGSINLIKLCLLNEVSQFVLISTDKAVRPTNIMGATKRISEIYAQLYNKKNKITKFSIIRFGNVIGSNGSVIPLFNYQIQKGGPITLTHKEITRYFMLIPEAVGLVLQSTYLSIGGEVFVLKMGKPIKIFDIAKKMIKLHGYSLRNNENPNGDVEIKIIGLRPGEKMHEELLIGNNPTDTAHPDIIMALEHIPDENNFNNFLIMLKNACENNDNKEAINLIKNHIEGMENYKNLK
jgi:FlaA1/EpsC-like NDP-sugar epimerase